MSTALDVQHPGNKSNFSRHITEKTNKEANKKDRQKNMFISKTCQELWVCVLMLILFLPVKQSYHIRSKKKHNYVMLSQIIQGLPDWEIAKKMTPQKMLRKWSMAAA